MVKQISNPRQLPNRYIYIAFLFATIVFVCLGDTGTAIIFGGIGLVFDPFDQAVPFGKRPFWQRTILLFHLLFVLFILGWGMAKAMH